MCVEQKQIFHWRRAVRNGQEISYCKRLLAGIVLLSATTAGVVAAPEGGVVTNGTADIAIGTTSRHASMMTDILLHHMNYTADESMEMRIIVC